MLGALLSREIVLKGGLSLLALVGTAIIGQFLLSVGIGFYLSTLDGVEQEVELAPGLTISNTFNSGWLASELITEMNIQQGSKWTFTHQIQHGPVIVDWENITEKKADAFRVAIAAIKTEPTSVNEMLQEMTQEEQSSPIQIETILGFNRKLKTNIQFPELNIQLPMLGLEFKGAELKLSSDLSASDIKGAFDMGGFQLQSPEGGSVALPGLSFVTEYQYQFETQTQKNETQLALKPIRVIWPIDENLSTEIISGGLEGQLSWTSVSGLLNSSGQFSLLAQSVRYINREQSKPEVSESEAEEGAAETVVSAASPMIDELLSLNWGEGSFALSINDYPFALGEPAEKPKPASIKLKYEELSEAGLTFNTEMSLSNIRPDKEKMAAMGDTDVGYYVTFDANGLTYLQVSRDFVQKIIATALLIQGSPNVTQTNLLPEEAQRTRYNNIMARASRLIKQAKSLGVVRELLTEDNVESLWLEVEGKGDIAVFNGLEQEHFIVNLARMGELLMTDIMLEISPKLPTLEPPVSTIACESRLPFYGLEVKYEFEGCEAKRL